MRHFLSGLSFLFFIHFLIFPTTVNAALDCEIGTVEVEVLPCGDGGYFKVNIDFDYANVGNEGFKIQGNGNDYGDFNYEDLPVTINNLLGDGETVYEFVVTDNQFEGCSNWAANAPVDCGVGDCYISELIIDDYPCEDGLYNVYLNFEHEDVSEEGFKLFVNEELFDEFDYADLPLNIGPFIGDGEAEYLFVVRDIISEDCASDKWYGPIDCGETGCNIWDVEADVFPCNESGYFNVAINFLFTEVGEEGFRIQGNGNDYGDFNYEDLPVIIEELEGDGETIYEFVVIDNEFGDCSDWTAIDPVDCDPNNCFISELSIDDHPCEGGQYNVYLNFEYENVSEAGFKLFVNWDLFGEYGYEDLPLDIGPFEGDGETEYHFLVEDAQFEDCASDKWFGPVECEDDECDIWDVNATILPCNDEGEFNVLINFMYENTGDDGFTIRGNGNNYGSFEYDELPVELGPFLADGETEHEFEARDNQLEGCLDWTAIDPFECDTAVQIDNLNLNMVDCEGSTYFLVVDFDYLNEGQDGFIISGNGLKPTTFDYEELPVTVGPLTNDEVTSYYFTLRDGEKVHFGNWERFLPFNCENLGLSDQPKSKDIVNVFPNPAYQKVWIKNHHSETVEVVIYNQSGAVLFKDISLSANETMQLQIETAGLYFFRAIGSSSFENGKIFITQ